MFHCLSTRMRRFGASLAGFILMVNLPTPARAAAAEPKVNNNLLLADPRPWCIGRFVIDRPSRSGLSVERYEFVGDKINITNDVRPGTFKHKVDARENELRNNKRTYSISYREMQERRLDSMIFETDIPWLETSSNPSENSRLFVYSEDDDASDLPFHGEGYVLAGSTMLAMKFILGSKAVQKVIQSEGDWYRNVSYRDDWTVPTERGFCINGALIGGPSRNSEEVTQAIVLQPGRTSALTIQMRNSLNADQQTSLLKTLPDLRQQLREQGYDHHVRIIRKGKRQLAGMDAEEALFSIKEGNVQLFRFYLLAPGNPDTTAQPHTAIQLNLGSAANSSATPEQATSPVDEAGAIQIWDTMLNSMRLRPGAM
jgi:hypothetical protein